MLGIFPRLIEMFKIVLSLGFTKYGTPSDLKKMLIRVQRLLSIKIKNLLMLCVRNDLHLPLNSW